MLASLSTWHGRSSAARIRSAIGRSRQARFGAYRSTPSVASTIPAAPTPIAITSSVFSDLASSTIVESVATSSSAGVGVPERSTIVPSRATRNALILVPPTSIPMASPSPRSGTSDPSEPEQRAHAVELPDRVVVLDRFHAGPAPQGVRDRRLDHVRDLLGPCPAGQTLGGPRRQ